MLLRTDWCKRSDSSEKFLNADSSGPHSPGPTAEAIQYLMDKGVIGWGSETVGTEGRPPAWTRPSLPIR